MATKHMIGFEWGSIEGGLIAYNLADYITWSKRSGSYSARLNPSYSDWDARLVLPFNSGLSDFYVQYAVNFYQFMPSASRKIFRWSSGSTVLGGVKLNHVTMRLELYTGDFATLVGTGVTTILIDRWYVIELHIQIGDSGNLELRLDGCTQVSFSGDTKPGSDTSVDNITIATTTWYNFIDDIIVNDTSGAVNNSWSNGAKIVLLKPNADGATKQWAPSAGSDHYSLVDESPPAAADYLQSTSPGQVEELDIENLPADAMAVGAVKVDMWGLKGSTSIPNQVKLGVKSGGANYMSSAKDLLLSQCLVSHLLDADPADGNAFTPSKVNSLQLVLESV